MFGVIVFSFLYAEAKEVYENFHTYAERIAIDSKANGMGFL